MRHILLVSYDVALLNTRQFLLESSGYAVTSAAEFDEALQKCKAGGYDLAIIGHSVPTTHRQALLGHVSRYCPTPVVALVRPGSCAVHEVDVSVDGNRPELLLAAIEQVLAKHSLK
jgi:CheY-like chemotaxis protein